MHFFNVIIIQLRRPRFTKLSKQLGILQPWKWVVCLQSVSGFRTLVMKSLFL
jgi:hypothetical protein